MDCAVERSRVLVGAVAETQPVRLEAMPGFVPHLLPPELPRQVAYCHEQSQLHQNLRQT